MRVATSKAPILGLVSPPEVYGDAGVHTKSWPRLPVPYIVFAVG